jgi:hypothetical protein
MATSMKVYAEIAGRYGVNSADAAAVDRFFAIEVPKKDPQEQAEIFSQLISRDNEPESPAPEIVQASDRGPKWDTCRRARIIFIPLYPTVASFTALQSAAYSLRQHLDVIAPLGEIEMQFLFLLPNPSPSMWVEFEKVLANKLPTIVHLSGHNAQDLPSTSMLWGKGETGSEFRWLTRCLQLHPPSLVVLDADVHRANTFNPSWISALNSCVVVSERANFTRDEAETFAPFYQAIAVGAPVRQAASYGKFLVHGDLGAHLFLE